MAKIKFKIIEVNSKEHSIVVRYYTDKITPEMLALDVLDGVVRRCRTDYSIDLPVPAPQGKALEEFIMARAPADWFQRMEAVNDPAIDTSLSAIQTLVGVEHESEIASRPHDVLSEEDILKMIATLKTPTV